MMETRSAVKVGLMVVVGAVLLFFLWRFFSHSDPNRFKVYAIFDDVKGLTRQTPLRMNGVPIGEVADVGLERGTLKPKVTLAIDNKYKGRIPADSKARISSGLLIQNTLVELDPGTSPSTLEPESYITADNQAAGMLAQFSPEADSALKQLNITIKTLTPQLSTTMKQLQGILKRTEVAMADVQDITGNAKSLVADPKIRQTMHGALNDLQVVSNDARRTALMVTSEFRGVVKRNGGKFDELTNGAVDLLQKFADTVDAARGAITKLTEQVSDPRLQQSLLETVELAKTTLARFDQIATDIHSLTGDPTVQSDLKATVSTLKETTEQGQKLIAKVDALVGAIKPGGKPGLGIGKPELSIDFLGRTNSPHFRSDLNVRVPFGENAVHLGLYDFAERYKLNAQYETNLKNIGAMRYGIYASKLGVGLDWKTSPGTSMRLDMYDPNKLQLDARALFKVNSDWSLWLGADSIFKRTTPLFGVRLNR